MGKWKVVLCQGQEKHCFFFVTEGKLMPTGKQSPSGMMEGVGRELIYLGM